jgi:predicted exporter
MAAVCALTIFISPIDFKTSFYDIIGTGADTVPAAVREHSSRIVPIMVSSKDAAKARAAADKFVELLPSNCCASVRYKFDGSTFSQLLSMYCERRAGLVSPSDEKLLETAQGRSRIARAAVRRYYSSPVPPLFSPADDPFCLADSFVTSLPVSFSGWSIADGVLTARRGDMTYVLILVELT